jgi:hypothetical protein
VVLRYSILEAKSHEIFRGRRTAQPDVAVYGWRAMDLPTVMGSGKCSKGAAFLSDEPSKLIPMNEEPNDQIVHVFRLRQADCVTY